MKKLVVVALLLGVGGGGVVMALSPAGARQVAPAQSLKGFAIDRLGLGPGVIRIRVTEAELTTLGRREAEREGYTEVSLISLACEPGEIVATARYATAGFSFPVLAHLVPRAAGGQVEIQVSGSQVGRLPLPLDTSQYVEGAIRQGLVSTGIGASLRVRSVTVERGVMTVEAEPALAAG